MRVFRDATSAILLGIIGGLLVTTISYYNHHLEGGLVHTLMAVVNSFDVVSDAYRDEESAIANLDERDMENVLETFQNMNDGQAVSAYRGVLQSLMDEANDGAEGDVLLMEGEDGNVDEGKPYSGILRFHVRANSDSKEDQTLKLAVKDDVVSFLKPLLDDCHSVEESKNVIVSNLQDIYTVAVNTVTEQGYDYTVSVYVTEEEFPAKAYGDITFPAGKYQALRVDIGEAKGQNWWCVMYPPLCFIDESTVIVSEDGKELLKENLTDEEYRKILANPDTDVLGRFKFFSSFGSDSWCGFLRKSY